MKKDLKSNLVLQLDYFLFENIVMFIYGGGSESVFLGIQKWFYQKREMVVLLDEFLSKEISGYYMNFILKIFEKNF